MTLVQKKHRPEQTIFKFRFTYWIEEKKKSIQVVIGYIKDLVLFFLPMLSDKSSEAEINMRYTLWVSVQIVP